MKKRRKIFDDKSGVASPIEGIIAFTIAIGVLSFYLLGINAFFLSYEEAPLDISTKTISIGEKTISTPGLASGWNMDWYEKPDQITDFGLGCTTDAIYKLTPDKDYHTEYNDFILTNQLHQDKPGEWITEPGFEYSGYIMKYVEGGIVMIPIEIRIPGEEVWVDPEYSALITYEYTPSSYNPDTLKYLEIKLEEDFPYGILDGRKIDALKTSGGIDEEVFYEKIKTAIGIENEASEINIEITSAQGEQLLSYGKEIYPDSTIIQAFSRIVLVQYYDPANEYYDSVLAELKMTVFI